MMRFGSKRQKQQTLEQRDDTEIAEPTQHGDDNNDGNNSNTSDHDEEQQRPKQQQQYRRGLVGRIRNWWKRKRRFYLVQDNSNDDQVAVANDNNHNKRDGESDESDHPMDVTMEESIDDEQRNDSGEKNDEKANSNNALEITGKDSTNRTNDEDDEDEDDDVSFIAWHKEESLSIQLPRSAMLRSPTPSRSTRFQQRAMTPPSAKSGSKFKTPERPIIVPFQRNRTKDSFQGSLESIDSLVESYWDPEDDGSQVTPITNNLGNSTDFFAEHVDFLRVQTQPRKVEVVWTEAPKASHSDEGDKEDEANQGKADLDATKAR